MILLYVTRHKILHCTETFTYISNFLAIFLTFFSPSGFSGNKEEWTDITLMKTPSVKSVYLLPEAQDTQTCTISLFCFFVIIFNPLSFICRKY